MPTIYHRVGIKTSAEKLFQALTTDQGLSQWWTHETSGADAGVRSIIDFKFNDSLVQFRVKEQIENKKVVWLHYGEMPPEWSGTEISFGFEVTDQQILLHMKHSNWQEASPFFAHCNLKWAVFLLSLKDYLETGQGKPFPNDVAIDHS
ncbi:SRPBCC domain-containing protein [Kangiella sp. TOML190]|uniref:SRPBCC family protein n=1 Tax=Kangiella sp. TOML190 TaxID=2931351 RepID=UPI00203FBF0E|nr:SRPBCC domain-containing protein [Kangiella sp. TOML190]